MPMLFLKFNHAAWWLNGNFFNKETKPEADAANEVLSTQHTAKCCFDDKSG